MHDSSMRNMGKFVDRYLDVGHPMRILDVGSQEVVGQTNSSYRKLFEGNNMWEYVGADLVKGQNVDVILSNPYRWKTIPSKSFDCVISGQMFEHDEYFWLTLMEIKRVLKTNGLCCIIAPSSGPEHRYPVDCYRYYPDGFRAVAKYVGLEVAECYAQWNQTLFPDLDPVWRDCIMIARRPRESLLSSMKFAIKSVGLKLLSMNTIKSFGSVDISDYSEAEETTYQDPTMFIRNYCPTIYLDIGNSFNEKDRLAPPGVRLQEEAVTSSRSVSYRFLLPDGCKAIRLDPLEGLRCIVSNLKLITALGIVSCSGGNGKHVDEIGYLFLDTTDPQLVIELDGNQQWIEISYCLDVIAN